MELKQTFEKPQSIEQKTSFLSEIAADHYVGILTNDSMSGLVGFFPIQILILPGWFISI